MLGLILTRPEELGGLEAKGLPWPGLSLLVPAALPRRTPFSLPSLPNPEGPLSCRRSCSEPGLQTPLGPDGSYS